MKILIIGDYSSFGLMLKKGFLQHNIETNLISTGDSWKKIDGSDIKLKNDVKNLLKKIVIRIYNRYLLYKFIKKKENHYDYILIMNQQFIGFKLKDRLRLSFTLEEIKKILSLNGKIYLLACGTDSYYLRAKEKLEYFTYDQMLNLKKELEVYLRNEKELFKEIAGIIPTMYDYTLGYKDSIWKSKLTTTVPLAFSVKEIPYVKNVIKDKIYIFHGIIREEFKGTRYIKKAMENIKEKYPDKVEIILDGNMPLEEYKKILKRANIIIDQCKSYSYGMNALYGMAMGKVVFSGNEAECRKEFKREDVPIINIKPNVKDIEGKIEYFVKNPELIFKIGEKSRKFVEEFHDCEVITSQYLKIFENKEAIDT